METMTYEDSASHWGFLASRMCNVQFGCRSLSCVRPRDKLIASQRLRRIATDVMRTKLDPLVPERTLDNRKIALAGGMRGS